MKKGDICVVLKGQGYLSSGDSVVVQALITKGFFKGGATVEYDDALNTKRHLTRVTEGIIKPLGVDVWFEE